MFQRPGLNLVGWRWSTCAFLILVLLATMGLSTSQTTALLQRDTEFTPASGHTQVIAQGVVVLPGDELAWRTVRYSAVPDSEAESIAWPLGFVLATTDPLLLTDEETGDQVRLGPGEAALVRDGTIQRRASLDGATASYLALELVPAAQANESDVGTILQVWPADVAAPGPHDIDLVRTVLIGNEDALLSGTGETNLLLVTEGPLEVGPPGEEGRSMLAGEALTFNEELETRRAGVAAGADAADGPRGVFVAAIIGPSVQASSTPEVRGESIARPTGPMVREPIGSISVQVFNCPPGMDPEDVVQEECTAATEDFDFILSSDTPDMTLTLADSVAQGNVYTWEGLPYGEYRVTEVVLPPGYETYVLTAEASIDGGPEAGYIVRIDETDLDVTLTVYNFRAS
jgi:hypothetical protein